MTYRKSMRISKFLLVYIGLFIYTIGRYLYRINITTPGNMGNSLILIGTMVCILGYLIGIKYRTKVLVKTLVFAIIVFGLLFIDSIPTGNHELLYVFIIMYCIRKLEIGHVMKFELWTISLLTMAVVLLNIVGLIDTITIEQGDRIRNGMGFISWSILPFQYLIIVFGITYLYRSKLKIGHLLIMELIGIYIYSQTLTRTGIVVLTVYLMIYYHKYYRRENEKKITKIWLAVPTIFFALSFLQKLVFIPDSPLSIVANKVLTGRIQYTGMYLNKYGISWLSQMIEFWDDLPLDNSYINVTLQWGIIGLLFVDIIYTYVIMFAIEEKDHLLLFIILIILICNITWNRLLNVSEAFFTLIFSRIFININIRSIYESKLRGIYEIGSKAYK